MSIMPTHYDWIYHLYIQQLSKKEVVDEKTVIQPDDFYYENGLMILTEQYHLRRGTCCGNGCKHCPYNHENVKKL